MVFYFALRIAHLLPSQLDAPKPDTDIEQHGDNNNSQVNHLDEPLIPNEPPPGELLSNGSTAFVTRIKYGLVLKTPRYSWWHLSAEPTRDLVKDIKKSFEVEEQILQILGPHPRVIPFLGVSHNPRGLQFAEANGGNLQAFLDQHIGTTSPALRLKWCSQAAEAVCFIHQKGVIHSDLRVENFLLHNSDLLLCDFGGSASGTIDGGHLPDSGFFNPSKPWVSTKATDIFSLGSVFYTIMTDHWPYRSPGQFTSVEDKLSYCDMVDNLFSSNNFPPTEELNPATPQASPPCAATGRSLCAYQCRHSAVSTTVKLPIPTTDGTAPEPYTYLETPSHATAFPNNSAPHISEPDMITRCDLQDNTGIPTEPPPFRGDSAGDGLSSPWEDIDLQLPVPPAVDSIIDSEAICSYFDPPSILHGAPGHHRDSSKGASSQNGSTQTSDHSYIYDGQQLRPS
ncbi:hypothetical protein AOCH_004971 [Aspergillus ochraceoroseus]|uniref:EKC/KEOPS complex subunit BUD32 n=1 Tax=Aspergillus ochraceoroseus TaxID=138278 RepID=A0A0F8TZG3_9EURO|nr:hypothetical protein AOCH_004971 [Aspergillus ochraceoroseus]